MPVLDQSVLIKVGRVLLHWHRRGLERSACLSSSKREQRLGVQMAGGLVYSEE